MKVFSVVRHWRDRLRQRQADLKLRAALLDKYVAGDADGAEAFHRIFNVPRHRDLTYAHRGRCRLCHAKVDLHSRHCGHCGAQWREFKGEQPHIAERHFRLFSAASLVVALIGGVCIKFAVGSLLRRVSSYQDFIEFAEDYLWVSGTILLLVLATYVYERLNIAAKGEWSRPAR
jgi:hypothetical protein